MRALIAAGLIVTALALPSTTLAKAKDKDNLAGTLAFLLGFGDAFEVKNGDKVETDGSPTLGIIPGIDLLLAKTVAFGGEFMFLWSKREGDDERQLLLSPNLRLRMSFPVYTKVTFDGMLGLGPTLWTGNAVGHDTRLGWSLRFSFGAGYALNDAVSLFADLGYLTSTTYGDDVTANLSTIPITAGLRSTF